MAGKTQKKMAEDFEMDLKYDEAITAFKRAADYFSMENLNAKSYEQGCLLKVADLMCINNHPNCFDEAKQIYEKIGMQYLTVPLLKSGAKEMFFKCTCVYIAYDDHVTAKNQLAKFLLEDPTMEGTREAIFLAEAIEALKDINEHAFKTAVTKLKTFSDMDKWRINVFTKIMSRFDAKDSFDNPL